MKAWPFVALCAVLCVTACSQTTNRELPAVRLSTPPVIDGNLDDPCWKEAATSSGFTDEMLGTPVADDTTVWIGYDERCIYAAFYAHDANPRGIIARETKRGADFRREDRVRLRINPFNSMRREDESEININPLGAQIAEFAGGRANKQEWEGAWQGAARIVEDGWVAEMAIPWDCFVRPNTNGRPVVIGLNFERYQARTQIRSYWSNLGPQERRELGGRWVGVVLPNGRPTNPLSALVYGFGGVEGSQSLSRAGADVRYQFTPSLTGVFTLKPDFSNIEGDVTSIDFSYAERLPQERRPFFLEGGDFLSPGTYTIRPFVSTRIDRVDYGVKLFGRVGSSTNVGVLGALAGSGRQDAVVTVRHQISPFDSLLFQGVTRSGGDVRNSIGFGSARLRRGDWTLQAIYARSSDRTGPGEGTDIYLGWSARDWYAGLNYEYLSRNLLARDGYVHFPDRKGLTANGGFWSKWRSGRFRRASVNLELSQFDHLDGTHFYDEVRLNATLENDRELSVSTGFSVGTFEENHDRVAWVGLQYPTTNQFSNVQMRLSGGRRGGSSYSALQPAVVHRFWGRLSVGLSSEIIRAGDTDEQHILTLSYDLAKDRSIGGRLVRRGGNTNGYLSLRKSGYGGTEYFLILGDPNAPSFRSRFVLKVVHPL